jgi:hypothetical protein
LEKSIAQCKPFYSNDGQKNWGEDMSSKHIEFLIEETCVAKWVHFSIDRGMTLAGKTPQELAQLARSFYSTTTLQTNAASAGTRKWICGKRYIRP